MAGASRAWQWFGGVVLPPLCFLAATWVADEIAATYRWARFDARFVLFGSLLHPSVSVAFLPFVLLASAATGYGLIRPERAAAAAWTRPALWIGLVASAVFAIPLVESFEHIPLLLGGLPVAGVAIVFGLTGRIRRMPPVDRRALAGAIVIALAVGGAVLAGPGIYVFVALGVLALGPWFSLLGYGLALGSLRARGPRPAGWFHGLWAAYAASWVVAIERAHRYYESLPETAPSRCFVVTAAAQGHPRFVRSRRTGARVVTDQLLALKAAEIRFAACAPRLHARLRAAYDGIGPRIARRIDAPWKADLVYTLLKPLEWAVRILALDVVRRRPR